MITAGETPTSARRSVRPLGRVDRVLDRVRPDRRRRPRASASSRRLFVLAFFGLAPFYFLDSSMSLGDAFSASLDRDPRQAGLPLPIALTVLVGVARRHRVLHRRARHGAARVRRVGVPLPLRERPARRRRSVAGVAGDDCLFCAIVAGDAPGARRARRARRRRVPRPSARLQGPRARRAARSTSSRCPSSRRRS